MGQAIRQTSTLQPQHVLPSTVAPGNGLTADIRSWYAEPRITSVGRADLLPLDPAQIFFNARDPKSRLAFLPNGTFVQMATRSVSLHGLMVADWLALDGIALDASVILQDGGQGLLRWRARGERRDRRYIATQVADGWYSGGIDQSGRLLFGGSAAPAAGLTRASHRRLLAGLPGLFFGEFQVLGGNIAAFNNRSRLYRTAEDLGRIAQREMPILAGSRFVAWPYQTL